MKAGFAQRTITPSLERPVYLAGFGTNRAAISVHDDLYARALCLSDAGQTVVLCALDLVGFFRPDVQAVVERVRARRPGVDIVIASTHTHHGPDTMGLWGPDLKTRGVDPAYMDFLKDQVEAAILGSLERQQTVESLASAAVSVPGVAKNARDPHIVDDELLAVQFTGTGGQPLALLYSFACHPETLWEDNPHITSDYPGYLRQAVEAAAGGPCIFFSGGLGGMMTPDVQEHTFEEAERIGQALARAGLQALAGAAPSAPGPIQLQRQEFQARLSNILYKLAFRRKLLPDPRDRRGQVTSEVSLVKLGGVWLAAVPGEILPRLGLRVKEMLRAAGAGQAGLIGLANDELGYILPVEDFRYPLNPFKPGKHYEETNSIGKDIAPKVMGALQSLIERTL